jgi:hypothetical protein
MPDIKLQVGAYNAGAWFQLSAATNAFNSLADGSFVRFTDTISNATALDLMCDMEASGVVGGTTVARSMWSVFVLPQRSDVTRYGDNTGSGASPPHTAYWVASIGVATGIASGAPAYGVTSRPFLLPRGVYMLGVQSRLTVALHAAPLPDFRIRTTGLQSV